MKKYKFLLIVFSIFYVQICYSQTKVADPESSKIKFEKQIVSQDTSLLVTPLLSSILGKKEFQLNNPKNIKALSGNMASLHKYPKNGVIYVKLIKLPIEYNPTLEIFDSSGIELSKIYVRNKISTVNMEQLEAGNYILVLAFNNEKISWEIEKE